MFNLRRENYECFVTIPDAFPPHELSIIRDLIEKNKPELASGTVGGNDINITDKQIRDSLIKWIMYEPQYQWIFERVASIINTANAHYFGLDLDFTESIQLTEYDAEYQGFYGAHTDMSFGTGSSRNRKLSYTMQLSDHEEYEGGDLLLYIDSIKNPVVASRVKGSMTIFRSHIIHEVAPVTKGTRYSFVSWVRGPLLK